MNRETYQSMAMNELYRLITETTVFIDDDRVEIKNNILNELIEWYESIEEYDKCLALQKLMSKDNV